MNKKEKAKRDVKEGSVIDPNTGKPTRNTTTMKTLEAKELTIKE